MLSKLAENSARHIQNKGKSHHPTPGWGAGWRARRVGPVLMLSKFSPLKSRSYAFFSMWMILAVQPIGPLRPMAMPIVVARVAGIGGG